MMYQYNTGFHSGFGFTFGIHVIAMLSVIVGVVLLIAWAIKNLPANALWKWGWITFVGGIVIALITMPALPIFGMMDSTGSPQVNGGFDRGGFTGNMPMMRGWDGDGDDEAAQTEEEAQGKALFDTLEAKETTCTDLADTEFELIGEYIMGQRLGDSHAGMNDMMKQMMGSAGEEQMHVIIGKSATQCDGETQDTTDSTVPRGMMMRQSSSQQ